MKITGYGSIKSTSSPKKTGGLSSAGSFADILAASESEDAAATSHVSDVAATSALNNLLALQEISEEDIQRKKLVQQGQNMVDTLDRLRQQILIGALPPHMLQDLSRQLSLQKQSVSDPRLTEIIEDIELRAAVELAKLEKALDERNAK